MDFLHHQMKIYDPVEYLHPECLKHLMRHCAIFEWTRSETEACRLAFEHSNKALRSIPISTSDTTVTVATPKKLRTSKVAKKAPVMTPVVAKSPNTVPKPIVEVAQQTQVITNKKRGAADLQNDTPQFPNDMMAQLAEQIEMLAKQQKGSIKLIDYIKYVLIKITSPSVLRTERTASECNAIVKQACGESGKGIEENNR
jgi:hypothetical protein